MPEPLILGHGRASLGNLERLYRSNLAARLDPARLPAVEASAALIERVAAGDAAVYGVNTGFGKNAQFKIPPHDVAALQYKLIVSTCCGMGPPTPIPIVRLMMALKINSLGYGASGVRSALIKLLEDMLEKDVVPVVPQLGSVGASGDLAPLAHMAAAMLGEGEAFHQGERKPAAQALAAAGLAPLVLGAKEGLALINGTQFSTAYALVGLWEARRLAASALVTGAMSVDALMASTAPFHLEIHRLRGHAGQISAANVLRNLLEGSDIGRSHVEGDERVQDPYCFRCQPQVMGACLDILASAARTLEIEASAVTDNPLVFAATGEVVSGGNFHADKRQSGRSRFDGRPRRPPAGRNERQPCPHHRHRTAGRRAGDRLAQGRLRLRQAPSPGSARSSHQPGVGKRP